MAKKQEDAFNVEKALEDYEAPAMFKAGLEYYITTTNPKINSQKDFDKLVKEYGELKLGE